MNVKVTAFKQPRLNVVPGYCLIPESRVFGVAPGTAIGSVTVRSGDEYHDLRLLAVSSWNREQKALLLNREFARQAYQVLKDHLESRFEIVAFKIEGIQLLHLHPTHEECRKEQRKNPCAIAS